MVGLCQLMGSLSACTLGLQGRCSCFSCVCVGVWMWGCGGGCGCEGVFEYLLVYCGIPLPVLSLQGTICGLQGQFKVCVVYLSGFCTH